MRNPDLAENLQTIRRLVRTPNFRLQLEALLRIDEVVFDSALERLTESKGFLNAESAQRQLVGIVSPETAHIIWNFARNCGALRNNIDCSAEKLASHFVSEFRRRQSDAAVVDKFEESDLVRVGERLAKLAAPIQGIELQLKAMALTDVIGNRLRDMAIVCDIRPVFDEERSNIEGLFPVATLQLTFETQQGYDKFETVLSPEQVDELAGLALVAQQKMGALQNLTAKCEDFGIESPKVWDE